VFMRQPRDVEIFEGNDDTVTFMCNASSNGMCQWCWVMLMHS